MNHFYPLSLNLAGPSGYEKGKFKEIVSTASVPSWYPDSVALQAQLATLKDKADAEVFEGSWWGAITKDEAYTGGIPWTPGMVPPERPKIHRIRGKKRRKLQPNGNGNGNGNGSATNLLYLNGHSPPSSTPSLESPRPVKLGNVVHRNVEDICEARKLMHQIQDWQRIEMEGGVLPSVQRFNEKADRKKRKRARVESRAREKQMKEEGRKRAKEGGEMGEEEAVMNIRRAAVGMLAHAGFESQSESSLVSTQPITPSCNNQSKGS